MEAGCAKSDKAQRMSQTINSSCILIVVKQPEARYAKRARAGIDKAASVLSENDFIRTFGIEKGLKSNIRLNFVCEIAKVRESKARGL
jgi:hypothetical protein